MNPRVHEIEAESVAIAATLDACNVDSHPSHAPLLERGHDVGEEVCDLISNG